MPWMWYKIGTIRSTSVHQIVSFFVEGEIFDIVKICSKKSLCVLKHMMWKIIL